jgi:hypothetical protein
MAWYPISKPNKNKPSLLLSFLKITSMETQMTQEVMFTNLNANIF